MMPGVLMFVDALNAGRWSRLRQQIDEDYHRTEVWYRWEGSERVELCMIFDEAGRLYAWSEWRNTRASLDQRPGLRSRLEDRIGA